MFCSFHTGNTFHTNLTGMLISLFVVYSFARAQNSKLNLLGRWTDGPCCCVAISEDKAYFGNGAAVDIINVADPPNSYLLTKIVTRGFLKQIEVKDSLLYALTYYNGIGIYDIHDFAEITEIYYIDTECRINHFHLEDSRLYVAADTAGLYIYDISNPSSPFQIGSYNTIDGAYGIGIYDDIIYLGVENVGMEILDASDLNDIRKIGDFQTGGDSYAYRLDPRNGILYATSNGFRRHYDKFHVLDIRDPVSPSELCSIELPGDWISGTRSLFVEDTLAYLAWVSDGGDGFMIVNVKDPSNAKVIDGWSTEDAMEVRGDNSYAYLADGYDGFKIVDIQEQDDDIVLFHYPTSGPSMSIFVEGQYAYVAANRAGMRIVDVSYAQQPVTVGMLDRRRSHWTTTSDIFVNNDYAFMVNSSGGLHAVDVSDPYSPEQVDWFGDPLGLAIFIKDGLAYIANYRREVSLWIVDVTDPWDLKEVLKLEESFNSFDVFVEDSLLFLACCRDGLKIFDARDAENLIEIATVDSEKVVIGVKVYGELAYLSEWDGVGVFDISNPHSPVLLGRFNDMGYAEDLCVAGGFAYVADYYFGLRVLDVSDPEQMYEVANYQTDGTAVHVFLSDNKIYLADNSDGFYIFEHVLDSLDNEDAILSQFQLKQNYPNPFNAWTKIKFNLDTDSHIKLMIFNIHGQLVEVLLDGYLNADDYTIDWDASKYNSGIYFYRLESNEFLEVKKCVLVR